MRIFFLENVYYKYKLLEIDKHVIIFINILRAMANLSCVIYGKQDLRLEERPMPEPDEGQVQIAVQRVGICGTDLIFFSHGAVGDRHIETPYQLGHEPSGVVTKLGKGVSQLKVGDRVAIEPGVPCRRCDYCKEGRYNLCPDVIFAGCSPVNGCLARYFIHAADFCHKLPENITYEEGALVECVAVAVQACRRAGVSVGHTVLICGAGPIGLVNMLTARAMGAAKVCVTDILQQRLDVAQDLGADWGVLVQGQTPEQIAAEVKATVGRGGPDITIECSGAPPSMHMAFLATRSGGILVQVGHGPIEEMTLPIVNAALREVDIRGTFRYANCYPTAIDLISSGRVNVKPLVTHQFELKRAVEAFEVARTRQGGAIKVLINCAE